MSTRKAPGTEYTRETWKQTYIELLHTAEGCGLPEEIGKLLAKNLQSERAMRRMISYLRNGHPRGVEDIADELLAIMEDRARWIDKKQSEEANMRYNAWLASDMRHPEEDDADE